MIKCSGWGRETPPRFIDHYPVRLRFATARHPFASEGDFCATILDEGEFVRLAKTQLPRPPTLRYGATPLHLGGELSRRTSWISSGNAEILQVLDEHPPKGKRNHFGTRQRRGIN
ncbi:MAG: hypothetical protein LBB23_01330 [Rickettsiales bacterium]|nr:hypothetical protein [Rickettsiales bacterium]